MTLMQQTALTYPCLLPEETAHPRFGLTTVLSVRRSPNEAKE